MILWKHSVAAIIILHVISDNAALASIYKIALIYLPHFLFSFFSTDLFFSNIDILLIMTTSPFHILDCYFLYFVYFFPLIKISCGKCALETLPSNLLLLSETADVIFCYFTEKNLDNAKDNIQSYTIYKW